MDVTLDEDFVNFESVSRTCASSPHAVGADEELILLDSEVSRRERSILGRYNSQKSDYSVLVVRIRGNEIGKRKKV